MKRIRIYLVRVLFFCLETSVDMGDHFRLILSPTLLAVYTCRLSTTFTPLAFTLFCWSMFRKMTTLKMTNGILSQYIPTAEATELRPQFNHSPPVLYSGGLQQWQFNLSPHVLYSGGLQQWQLKPSPPVLYSGGLQQWQFNPSPPVLYSGGLQQWQFNTWVLDDRVHWVCRHCV